MTVKKENKLNTGKRKNAIARVWLKPGSGKIAIGKTSSAFKNLEEYFGRQILQMIVKQPLEVANRASQYDIFCTVLGGGLSGQAGAIRHGISKALVEAEPDLKQVLRQEGFLTRDARVVERKKPGFAKARRRFQFSKR